MQVKLTPLSAGDGRLHPRRSLRLRASLRDPGRDALDAIVVDLSESGCRLEGVDSLEEGDRFLIKLPGLEARSCRVAWVRRREIGCEFDTPLYRGERETIQAQVAPAKREKTGIFGRRLRLLVGQGGGSEDER
jgi:hypothetical protein